MKAKFSCPECGRTFKSKSGLGSHRRYEHGIFKVKYEVGGTAKEDAMAVLVSENQRLKRELELYKRQESRIAVLERGLTEFRSTVRGFTATFKRELISIKAERERHNTRTKKRPTH